MSPQPIDEEIRDTVDITTVPQKPPELTAKQLGQLRRQYFTVVHGRVKACGHKAKFSKTQQPNSNCTDCWTAFFMTSVDLEGVHVLLTQRGVPELVKQRGKKFVKMFHGFLSSRLLPTLAAEVNKGLSEMPVPATNVQIEGSVIDVQKDKTNEDRSDTHNDAIPAL